GAATRQRLASALEQRSSSVRRLGLGRTGRRARTWRVAYSSAMRGAVGGLTPHRHSRGICMLRDRQIVFTWNRDSDPSFLRNREWLLTNGLGGYASGTLAGIPARKYHGLFVPNLATPKGRHILISRCD